MEQRKNNNNGNFHTKRRFGDRGKEGWVGPLVDYKEVEMLRKFMTSSSKIIGRRRAGTSAQEQNALKQALKRARYMGLLPYHGN